MTSRASNAADASSRNAKILQSVLDTLRRAGFPPESLQTVAFGVGPNFDYEHGNITFESDSVEMGRRTALAQALAKARSDAEALATAAGGSLGRLLEVSARPGFLPGAQLEAVVVNAYAGRSAPAITPPDVVVRVSVQARWEFAPGH